MASDDAVLARLDEIAAAPHDAGVIPRPRSFVELATGSGTEADRYGGHTRAEWQQRTGLPLGEEDPHT